MNQHSQTPLVDRVRAGATLMDATVPGWEHQVHPDSLTPGPGLTGAQWHQALGRPAPGEDPMAAWYRFGLAPTENWQSPAGRRQAALLHRLWRAEARLRTEGR